MTYALQRLSNSGKLVSQRNYGFSAPLLTGIPSPGGASPTPITPTCIKVHTGLLVNVNTVNIGNRHAAHISAAQMRASLGHWGRCYASHGSPARRSAERVRMRTAGRAEWQTPVARVGGVKAVPAAGGVGCRCGLPWARGFGSLDAPSSGPPGAMPKASGPGIWKGTGASFTAEAPRLCELRSTGG